MLSDKKCIDNFKTFFSLQQWWDCGKALIKDFYQKYTLNVTRDIAQSMKVLETEIVALSQVKSSQVTFIYIALLTIQIVSKHCLQDVKTSKKRKKSILMN